jgi:O-antigen ligase
MSGEVRAVPVAPVSTTPPPAWSRRGVELAVGLAVLACPAAYFAIRGAGSFTLVAALLLASGVLLADAARRRGGVDRTAWWFVAAMVAPTLAVLASELEQGGVVANTFDVPIRFAAAAVVFLALRRRVATLLPWISWSFPLGAAVCLVIVVNVPEVAGERYWLNRIHFGDVAMAVGMLSLMTLNWPQRDSPVLRAAKLAGSAAGIAASLLSTSRGGWIVFPVIAVLALVATPRLSRMHKLLVALLVLGLLVAPYFVSSTVQTRVDAGFEDLRKAESGQLDTSLGIRFQHWRAAGVLLREDPIFGAGANGYRREMPKMGEAGLITPFASRYTELHNQALAFAADHGVLGLLAILAAQFVPVLLARRAIRSGSSPQRRAAWMLVVWVLCFFLFGLTQEIYSLKSTVSLFALVLAVLAAAALPLPRVAAHPAQPPDGSSAAGANRPGSSESQAAKSPSGYGPAA